MCSPKAPPPPPRTITIQDRDVQIAKLQETSATLAKSTSFGSQIQFRATNKAIDELLKIPVDKAASVFTPQGPTGQQTISPGATGFQAAPDSLTPLLQKRVASTLRIPYAPPKPVPTTPPANT